jgi:hypothetical protein
MNMKKYALLLPVIIIIFSIQSIQQTKKIHITVEDSLINRMQGGFGASMHALQDSLPVDTENGIYRSWGGSAWGGNPEPGDSLRWNQVFNYADWLGFDWCRVEIDHGMYEPDKMEYDFYSREIKILFRWLDYCQSRNIDVYLTEMWPNAKWLVIKEFNGNPVKELMSAPNDIESWSGGYIHLLNFLIKKKQYTCIKWISVCNEPMESWGWWRDTDSTSQDILPALEAMKKKIDASRLPVRLVATDGPFRYAVTDEQKYLPYVGAIGFHDYSSMFDWSGKKPLMSETAEMTVEWKKLAKQNNNIPLFISEFGSFIYGIEKNTDGPSRWTSLMHDIQLVIRLCNAGVDGMNRWSFLNRGDLDGQWQMIDTWDTSKHRMLDEIRPHPNSYYLYGLITRFTAKNSDVLKTKVLNMGDEHTRNNAENSTEINKHVFAAAFRSPDDNYSVFITNDSEYFFPVEISLPETTKMRTFYRYEITKTCEGKSDCRIDPVNEFQIKNKLMIKDKLNPESIILFTTYNKRMGEIGIR